MTEQNLFSNHTEWMEHQEEEWLREELELNNWPLPETETLDSLREEWQEMQDNRRYCVGEHCSCTGPGWRCEEPKEEE